MARCYPIHTPRGPAPQGAPSLGARSPCGPPGNKPTAVICHAGWMLAEADVADGRVLTSWPSIKTDLVNAGARWVDREVVEDGNLTPPSVH